MNSVIKDIGLLQYIQNSKWKINSIYLITRFQKQLDYRYLTMKYILNSKYKINSIYLITRFHEQSEYKYWNNNIYFEFTI